MEKLKTKLWKNGEPTTESTLEKTGPIYKLNAFNYMVGIAKNLTRTSQFCSQKGSPLYKELLAQTVDSMRKTTDAFLLFFLMGNY